MWYQLSLDTCSVSLFDILSGLIANSLWYNVIVAAYIKQLTSLVFFGFIVAFLVLIQSGAGIYDAPRCRSTLWKWIFNLQHFHIQNYYLCDIIVDLL